MRTILAVAFAFVSGNAVAQYSGAELRRDILSEKREQQIAALYYVSGVIDQTSMTYNFLKLSGARFDRSAFFCLPETAKLGDVFAIVRRRMESPEVKLSEPAVTHIMRAVKAAWPCIE